MWIEREISDQISKSNDPIQVIRGPRQCGKTSLILRLDPSFKEVSLDDPAYRELAQRDPELFLKQWPTERLFIDEAQYAPRLFPSLKRKIDLARRDPSRPRRTLIRLTGSNQIVMDQQVKESLAGRAAFFDLNTLSISEILRSVSKPIQQLLFQGGWPELYAYPEIDPKKYLDDYISSYVEKDIVLSAGIQKRAEFLRFAQLLAGRVGCIVDYSHLGRDAGVDTKTAKEWLSVLERMHIIAVVRPYLTNLSSRLIKSPKVYFLDTGLACRLQGWTSPDPIITSPQQGALFENLVYAELHKLIGNWQLGWKVFHWRSRAQEEVDFLIQISPDRFLFLEAKVSAQPLPNLSEYPEVRKVFGKRIPELYLCHQEGERVLDRKIPIAFLAEFLRKSF
jgi:predicted AAA+ superfamily ATPase